MTALVTPKSVPDLSVGTRRLRLILPILLLAWLAPIAPSGASPSGPPALLTVVAQGKVQSRTVGTGVADFGSVDPAVTPRLDVVFTLRNDGKQPLTIGRVESSGVATRTALGRAGVPVRATLAVGEQVPVLVSVDLAHVRGPVRKSVWVFAAGDNRPAATLRITATLQEAVSASPLLIDFGQAPFGKICSLPLSITVDPRLLPSGAALQATSSNPDIHVHPLPREPGQADRRFLVTLSPLATLGRIAGEVSVCLTPGAAPVATIPLAGLVVGRVTARPSAIRFDRIPLGREAVRRVSLAGADASDGTECSVSCVDPRVSVRLLPPTAGKIGPEVLEVTLKADTVLGGISTQVVVATKDGERLVLPVLGTVAVDQAQGGR